MPLLDLRRAEASIHILEIEQLSSLFNSGFERYLLNRIESLIGFDLKGGCICLIITIKIHTEKEEFMQPTHSGHTSHTKQGSAETQTQPQETTAAAPHAQGPPLAMATSIEDSAGSTNSESEV